MLISIFTPTHDPVHLSACHRSVTSQTYTDYEWVIVPNGGARIPDEVAADPKVRIHKYPGPVTPGVGALKTFACGRCSGELFVELDHDDLLMPHALSALAEAVTTEPGGFYYSDYVELKPDGSSETYWGRESGWETYPLVLPDGKLATALRAFDPCPRSLAHIEWAPNHIRAWSRSAYRKSGGHDPAMALGDDHDLICRTYLAGVPMVHIPDVLYIYQQHEKDGLPTNSSKTRHDEIQKYRDPAFARYAHRMVVEWCRRFDLPVIDLIGPRSDVRWPDGLLAVDEDGHVTFDLDESSVGWLRISDLPPRLKPGCEVVKFWNHLYRALAPGGWVTMSMPASSPTSAGLDLDQKSLWGVHSHRHVTVTEWRDRRPDLDARFSPARVEEYYPSSWHRDANMPYVRFDLVAYKGQRLPGEPL
jgi:glycosyltransferase involved in cell wall biosynthesis